MRRLALLFLIVVCGISCASSGAAAPVTVPALLGNDDLLVVSGQLMLRSLTNATVIANGKTTLTNARGMAAFDNLPINSEVELSYPEHLRLQTRYWGRSWMYVLWPLSPDADRNFVQQFAFSFDGGHLRRFAPNTIAYLIPTGVLDEPLVRDVHRLAGERLTALTNNQVTFVVANQVPVNSIFFILRLNPKMDKKYAALTTLEFYGDVVVGGTVEYRSLRYAQNSQIVNHELTHVVGVGHTKRPGLMNAMPDEFEELAPWERLVLANMYRQKPGTTLKGNVINDRNTNKLPAVPDEFSIGQRRVRIRKVSCQLPLILLAAPKHVHR